MNYESMWRLIAIGATFAALLTAGIVVVIVRKVKRAIKLRRDKRRWAGINAFDAEHPDIGAWDGDGGFHHGDPEDPAHRAGPTSGVDAPGTEEAKT